MARFLSLLMLKCLIIFASINTIAQDTIFARTTIQTLASKQYYGRGYVKDGDLKTARFICKEFRNNKLLPLGTNHYLQPFTFPINTLPGTLKLSINGKRLKPGIDFMVSAGSPYTKGKFSLVHYKGSSMDIDSILASIGEVDLSNQFLVIPEYNRKFVKNNPLKARGIICLSNEDKLWWKLSDGQEVEHHTTITIKNELLPKTATQIELNFKSKFYPKYKSNNVIGYVNGTEQPDSFIVYTAHYDHLGMMGNQTWFPGGNDNASGTAMLLDLAKHYSQHPAKYSMVFIAFSGEEVGLLGSKYFSEHPSFSLKNIHFLVNLDMVGTGSEGITAVNGTVFNKEFAMLQDINSENSYLLQVKSRGEACNSDHCPLYQKGVPSFFIYTTGNEYTEYHNVYDTGADVPLSGYCNLFQLLINFNDTLQNTQIR